MAEIQLQVITATDVLLAEYPTNNIDIGGGDTVTQVIIPLIEGADLIVYEGYEGVLRLGDSTDIEFEFTNEIAQFFLTDFNEGGSAKDLFEMIARNQVQNFKLLTSA